MGHVGHHGGHRRQQPEGVDQEADQYIICYVMYVNTNIILFVCFDTTATWIDQLICIFNVSLYIHLILFPFELIDNVHNVRQHVPEVLKIILIRFPLKKSMNGLSHDNEKNIVQLLDYSFWSLSSTSIMVALIGT